MKKILCIVFITLFLSACYITRITGNVIDNSVDLNKYTKNGFLFSPDEYLGKYDAISFVDLIITPKAGKTPQVDNEELRSKYDIQGFWVIQRIEIKDAIDSIYIRTKALGANAVTNFKSEYFYLKTLVSSYPVEYIELKCVRITGYAIKRKD